jgi:hypothetical protein
VRKPADSIRQALSKSNQHATYFRGRVHEFVPCRPAHEAEVGRQFDMRAKFVCGPQGKINEARHVPITPSTAAFSDIRRDRYCGPSGLVDQAEPFRSRVHIGRPVDQDCEVPAPLPNLQLREVIHPLHIRSVRVRWNASPWVAEVIRQGLSNSRPLFTAYCLLMAAYS